jgi:type IV pilus assembly protein PilE
MSDRALRRCRGVTLIELMVVIVVIAILGSIAVPTYRSYMLRAQRADAKAELLRVRTAQEKFFLQNNRYATVDEFDDAPADGGLGFSGTSEHGYYTIDMPVATPTTYTIRARATGGQTADGPCQTFTVDELGQRASEDGSAGDTTEICWRR